MKQITISVALATYNEENNIVDCIESLKKVAEEIVIVDGNSQDRTAELARIKGAKVIQTTNKPMFNINKNLAIKNCKGKWVLLIDADERVSEELAREIKKIISTKPKENGFFISRKNWFLGGFLTKGGAYPDSVIRFFKKGKGVLPEKNVHEQVEIVGEIGHLKNDILHIADPNFERYLRRVIRYTDRTADDLRKEHTGRGIKQVIFFMLIRPILTFLSIYFRHRGYVDGFRGFVWALFSASHHFYAYVKYWSSEQSPRSKT